MNVDADVTTAIKYDGLIQEFVQDRRQRKL